MENGRLAKEVFDRNPLFWFDDDGMTKKTKVSWCGLRMARLRNRRLDVGGATPEFS
jgi:hypothetical protein